MKDDEILIDVRKLEMVPSIDPEEYHRAVGAHQAGAVRANGIHTDNPDLQLSLVSGGDIDVYNVEFVCAGIDSTACLLVRQPTKTYPEFYALALQHFEAERDYPLIAPMAAVVSGCEDDDRNDKLYIAILRAIQARRNERLISPL